MVFGPFNYCASCERAAPDAPETIYDPRRFTGGRYRTICGASRGSASLPRLPVLTFCEPGCAGRAETSTIKGAAPDVIIGQPAAARAGARIPTGAAEVAWSYHFYG